MKNKVTSKKVSSAPDLAFQRLVAESDAFAKRMMTSPIKCQGVLDKLSLEPDFPISTEKVRRSAEALNWTYKNKRLRDGAYLVFRSPTKFQIEAKLWGRENAQLKHVQFNPQKSIPMSFAFEQTVALFGLEVLTWNIRRQDLAIDIYESPENMRRCVNVVGKSKRTVFFKDNLCTGSSHGVGSDSELSIVQYSKTKGPPDPQGDDDDGNSGPDALDDAERANNATDESPDPEALVQDILRIEVRQHNARLGTFEELISRPRERLTPEVFRNLEFGVLRPTAHHFDPGHSRKIEKMIRLLVLVKEVGFAHARKIVGKSGNFSRDLDGLFIWEPFSYDFKALALREIIDEVDFASCAIL